MGDGKVNLPEDLLSSNIKTFDGNNALKDETFGDLGSEKGTVGSLDDSKDQVSSESSIPLSPQWLYSKPVDLKTFTAGDKKDWRRSTPEVDISWRWREEERETNLLGRRDQRKEDRHAATMSTLENKTLPVTDRRHDGWGSGLDSKRDSKWSSRWGLEDKEKESRTEKRNDIEKEDSNVGKQSSGGSGRSAPESDVDARDKWRPRHRMEAQAGGMATNRVAPGFGLDRGRTEGSIVRFSPGRGRSNASGKLPIGRSPLGSAVGPVLLDKHRSILGKSFLSGDLYCYPRGKLLDVYRKQKSDPTFDALPDGMDDAPSITWTSCVEPLAFVAPAEEEERVLKDIWKGITVSSEVLRHPNRGKAGWLADSVVAGDMVGSSVAELKQSICIRTKENDIPALTTANDSSQVSSTALISDTIWESDTYKDFKLNSTPVSSMCVRDGSSVFVVDGKTNTPNDDVAEQSIFRNKLLEESALPKLSNLDGIKVAASEIANQLSNDSTSLFESSSTQISNVNQNNMKINEKIHLHENVIAPEKLSLCYLDPQGVIQGPFLGIDIMLWFEQGFFGTDLLVRLSDAHEGSPFQELGDIMPHLKIQFESAVGATLTTKFEASSEVGGNLDLNASASNYNSLNTDDNQLWTAAGFDVTANAGVQFDAHNSSEILLSENQGHNNFSYRDDESFFYRRPGSSNGSALSRPTNTHPSYSHDVGISAVNKFPDCGMHNQEVDKSHTFGLLMSDLRDSIHLRRSQSKNLSAIMGDDSHFSFPLHDRDVTFANHNSHAVAGNPNMETWSDRYGMNRHFNPNVLVGSLEDHHLSHVEPRLNNFEVAEHLMSQKLQKERLQRWNSLSTQFPTHLTGPGIEQLAGFYLPQKIIPNIQQSVQNTGSNLEHVLDLQIQQQREFEVQQLHQIQRQQLLQQQMKLQQQQDSHVQQLLLELSLHQQRTDPRYKQLELDHARKSLFDQVQLRTNLHELQQNSHSFKSFDPSMEQIIQANIEINAMQGRQSDFANILAHAKHAMPQSEQQLPFQQEQLQAEQLSMALKQQLGLEAEQFSGSSCPVNNSILGRNSAAHLVAHSAGFSGSDIQQHLRFSPQEEHVSFPEQNQRGPFETSSLAFERSTSGALGVNFDSTNTYAQGLDSLDWHHRLMAGDPLNSSSLHEQLCNDFYAHHPHATRNSLSGSNGHPGDSWSDPRMHLLQLEAELRRNELGFDAASADLLNIHTSAEAQEEISKRALSDLFHKKLGLQQAQSSIVDSRYPLLSRNQGMSWQISQADSCHPFELPPDHELRMNNSLADSSRRVNASSVIQNPLVRLHINESYNKTGGTERMSHITNPGALMEEQFITTAGSGDLHSGCGKSMLTGKAAVENDTLELEDNEGKRQEFRDGISSDLSEQSSSSRNSRDLPITDDSRHSSTSGLGDVVSFIWGMGLNSSVGEVTNDRIASAKVFDNAAHRCPPVSRVMSSPDVQIDSSSASDAGQRSLTVPVTDGSGRREPSGTPLTLGSNDAQVSGRKDVHSRRTSSCSDGSVTDTSFIAMVKRPLVLPEDDDAAAGVAAATDLSDGGAQGVRSGKKKGKKGRQIDPSLLGFRVSSNRIMMGEIHRLED